ncbi:hypothetical protein BG000_003502, partial [Podila horticola]
FPLISSVARKKDSPKKRYFEMYESPARVKWAKKRKMDTSQRTHDSKSASSSDLDSDSGSDIDSNMDTNHSMTPPDRPSRPAQLSATSRHGCTTLKPKHTRLPITETVHRSAVGNTSMKCNFDVAE